MRKDFRIPVPAYLKKYFVKQFFSGQHGPHKIEEDTLIGKHVMSLLLDARTRKLKHKHLTRNKRITRLPGESRGAQSSASNSTAARKDQVLEVILSEAMAKRSPNISKLIRLNTYLEDLFQSHLVTWIRSADFYGIPPYASSKDFLAYFAIDESEYSHDGAYRYWQRYKSDQQIKIKMNRATVSQKEGTGVVIVARGTS